jgi:GxxExxY protein
VLFVAKGARLSLTSAYWPEILECDDPCIYGGVLIDDGTGGLSGKSIGVAIRVHRKYGPGLLEKAYRIPYVHELRKLGYPVETQKPLPLDHEGVRVECAYWMDIVVDGRLVIEVKSVERILPVHIQQLKTYLRLSGIRTGLLINFNVPILRHGVRRVLLDEPEPKTEDAPA